MSDLLPPDSLPSMALFSDFALDEKLLKTLSALELMKPTTVQSQTIPKALQLHDLLVSSQTGSGKTLAYLLPTLHQFLSQPDKNPTGTRALILVPTRELAQQIFKHCTELTSKTSIKSAVITGGNDLKFQSALLRKNPEIIIATPGRLLELLQQHKADLGTLEVLILDEADRMLDMGFSDDVLTIITRCNKQRQTLLFSATLQHRVLNTLVDKLMQSPQTITINTIKYQHADITQQIILADNKKHKKQLLSWLLNNESFKKTLVFCRTRIEVEQLGGLLRYQKVRVGILHGEIKQDQRKKTLQLFRHNTIDVLIASDVAARGLDIKDIDLIINMEMPNNSDNYIHRIGRTGRANNAGLAITLIGADDWNNMISTERYLGIKLNRRSICGLKAKYAGPKKQKSSGKAAGSKVKKNEKKKNKSHAKKSKPKINKPIDGFSPLKKK